MAKRSGPKGDEFERLMASKLNEAYNTEEFVRTPGSGAFVGLTNFGKKFGLAEDVKRTLASDLITPEWFKFSVECKWYKDKPNYAAIIKGSDTDLDGWLGETLYDAINLKLAPLLFFKTNRKGVHVALWKFFKDIWIFRESTVAVEPNYYLVYGDFLITDANWFLENNHLMAEIAEDVQKSGALEVFFEQSPHVVELLDKLKVKKLGKI